MALAVAIASWIAAALALTLVVVLLRTGRWRVNRLLVGLLALEGLLQLFVGLGDFLGDNDPRGVFLFIPVIVGLAGLAWGYLVFVSRLDTPIVRFARGKAARTVFGILAGGAALIIVTYATLTIKNSGTLTGTSDDPLIIDLSVLTVFACLVFSSIVALAGSIHAWSRAPKGDVRRARAGAFALAFGTRDALLAAGLIASEVGDVVPGHAAAWLNGFGDFGFSLATMAFIPLLTYGMLRTQLFDIDLRIKVGIQRSTVVTIVAATSIIIGKIVDRYAQAQWGWVAGVAAAVGMLFFTRGLNKVGEKVAERAMPQVQPTPAYVQFKKLDVYRTAVESALENDGAIDDAERRMLERLRAKLALAPDDCAAVETEARETALSASPAKA